jgi:hypothetical protein
MTLERYTRRQAALIHLAVSAAIVALVVAAMVLLWYPAPYFQAAGGRKLLLLVIGVNFVVGPLLTLIVFVPGKKGLARDLAIIAALQVATLAYGVAIMYEARPAYIVHVGDRFELVTANALADADLAGSDTEYRTLPLTGPRIVGTALPMDEHEREGIAERAMFGAGVELYPKYYVPYAYVAQDVAARAQPIERLRSRNPEGAADIDAWVAAAGRPATALRYVPLVARYGDMTVVVDGATGDVLGVLAVDPW